MGLPKDFKSRVNMLLPDKLDEANPIINPYFPFVSNEDNGQARHASKVTRVQSVLGES